MTRAQRRERRLLAAARRLDRLLDLSGEKEAALWLDTDISDAVYKARIRLAGALDDYKPRRAALTARRGR